MNRQKDEKKESSDDSIKVEKKHEKKKHKEKKRKKKKRKLRTSYSESENEKRSHRKHKKIKRKKSSKEKKKDLTVDDAIDAIPGPSVPADLIPENSKSRAPMTKEEWEKSQSVVRRVYDETGRSRLIKGDGEVLEEIVSKKRHREINQQATLGDGLYFENKIYKK